MPGESRHSFASQAKGLAVSQEVGQKQVGLMGSLGRETSRGESVCIGWLETRWEFTPSTKSGLEGHPSELGPEWGQTSEQKTRKGR